MSRSLSGQTGFTMVEFCFALAIVGVVVGAIGAGIADRIQESRITSSIEQARTVLRSCEIARRKVIGTTVTGGVASHTYPALSSWSPTSALQARLATDHKLPVTNHIRSEILVKFDAARCYVAVDLPFLQDGYGGLETETVSGKTRLIISSPRRLSNGTSWVTQQKRFLHLEATR